MDNEIKNKLQEVFRKVFEDPQLFITENTTADNITMWDSLTHMELIAEVENAFAIQFTLNEVMDFNTVGDMVKAIEKNTH